MSDDVRLRAIRDIPGIRARLADGNYTTRRLKTGDIFFVPSGLADLLVTRMQKAVLARVPGTIAPPPSSSTSHIASLGPTKQPAKRAGNRRTATPKK